MPSREREDSLERDRESKRPLRSHQSSSSMSSALIPMWDSSDPERAPPPLPLNPSSPLTTSARASSAIVTAAAALSDRVRESIGSSPFIVRDLPPSREGSPSRLLKDAQHRRMQSLQSTTGNVKELSNLLEGGNRRGDQSPEKSPERSSVRRETPSLDSLREIPAYTPIRPHTPILRENTPPSATMLALRNTPTPLEMPENIISPPQSRALVKSAPSIDALSVQIKGLTSIANNLQDEMSMLSRRSKDNAADLVSLQKVTTSRDEDIRKALRDLLENISLPRPDSSAGRIEGSKARRDSTSTGSDEKNTSLASDIKSRDFGPLRTKSSETLRSDGSSMRFSSASYAMDGTAILAMLEKLMREVANKTGQDQLISGLSELIKAVARDGCDTSKKLEDIIGHLKALGDRPMGPIPRYPPPPNGQGPRSFSGQMRGPPPTQRLGFENGSDGPPGQVARIPKDIAIQKQFAPGPTRGPPGRRQSFSDSINGSAIGGDVIGEDTVKLLHRLKDSITENGGLTAETKALVRELRGEVLGLGREIGRKLDKAEKRDSQLAEDKSTSSDTLSKIIEEGLEDLQENMSRLFKEYRRQSSSSVASKALDKDDVYVIVRQALAENSTRELEEDHEKPEPIQKEHILDAIREAWEAYRPEEPTHSHVGIDRDEIMDCLREGLLDYKPEAESGVTREVVLDALKEGLDNFQPPPVEPMVDPVMTREEILGAFRECLETMDLQSMRRDEEIEGVTREEILDAVKEGLASQDRSADSLVLAAPPSFTKDDIIEAVREGFSTVSPSNKEIEHELLDRLEEVIEGMRNEFQLVSEEAKQNLTASGRDTEQVLDAIKDGMQQLKEEMAHNIVPAPSVAPTIDHEAILLTLKDNHDRLRAEIERLGDKPVDMTGTDEILDALREGLASLRADIDGLKEDAISPKPNPNKGAIIVPDGLQRSDLNNLEVMIAQLRIKVEAMDASAHTKPTAHAPAQPVKRDDLTALEEMIRGVQLSLDEISLRERPFGDGGSKEDLDAIETLLQNTKAKVDAINIPELEALASKDDMEILAGAIKTIKDSVIGFVAATDSDMLRKTDLGSFAESFEELKMTVKEAHDSIIENSTGAKKEDFEAIETIVTNMKVKIDEIAKIKPELLPSKEDITTLAESMKELKSKSEEYSEASSRVYEEQSNGLGEKVEAVGLMIAEIKDEISNKLEGHSKGVKDFASIFEAASGSIADNFKETLSTVDKGFRATQDVVERVNTTQEEKATEVLEKMEIFATLIDELRNNSGEKDAALNETKEVIDELKTLIDTLGITFNATGEKMSFDSKTLFDRVEQTHGQGREDHYKTWQEVQRVSSSIDSFRGEFGDYQPKLFAAIKDLKVLISQHFEYVQTQSEKTPPPVVVQAPIEQPALLRDVPEKYDDTNVQTKLDQLISHVDSTDKSSVNPELLEQIHEQMKATAAEMSEFINTQTTVLAEIQYDKQKQADEAGRALDQRVAQKSIVEADVVRLSQEKEELALEVAALRAERAGLANDKLKLSAEVASIETAIKIRREELAIVEARAESLERRILEGVIDHSRALLVTRSSKDPNTMSLKRVASNASTSTVGSLNNSTLGAALKKRQAPRSLNVSANSPGGRRIHSLNQITMNVPTGSQAYDARSIQTKGFAGLKRSHSVKAGSGNGAGSLSNRKVSLPVVGLTATEPDHDKENAGDPEALDDSAEVMHSERAIDKETFDDSSAEEDRDTVIDHQLRNSIGPSILGNAETLVDYGHDATDVLSAEGEDDDMMMVLHSGNGQRLYAKGDKVEDESEDEVLSAVDIELDSAAASVSVISE
jgi:hypothetical protein